MHGDGVMGSGGNVDGAVPRHDPGLPRGAQPHDAGRCIEQLIARVFMKWNNKPFGEIFGHHPDRLRQILIILRVRAAVSVDSHVSVSSLRRFFGVIAMKFGMTSHFRQG
jgi:hypothetical protein